MTRKLLMTLTMIAIGSVTAQASPLEPVARCVKATGHAAVHGVASGVKAVEKGVRKVVH